MGRVCEISLVQAHDISLTDASKLQAVPNTANVKHLATLEEGLEVTGKNLINSLFLCQKVN